MERAELYGLVKAAGGMLAWDEKIAAEEGTLSLRQAYSHLDTSLQTFVECGLQAGIKLVRDRYGQNRFRIEDVEALRPVVKDRGVFVPPPAMPLDDDRLAKWIGEVVPEMRVLRAYGEEVRGTTLDHAYLQLLGDAVSSLRRLLSDRTDDDRAALRSALVDAGLEPDDHEDRDNTGGG